MRTRRGTGERCPAAALLLACTVLFGTANAVHAQTEIWSATLNIAEPDAESGPEGYCSAALNSAFPGLAYCDYGSVTGADGASFEVDGTTYTVESIRYEAGQEDRSLEFHISPGSPPLSQLQDWQLQIGGFSFSLSDAAIGTAVGSGLTIRRYSWDLEDDDSDRPWPEPGSGSTVAVKLVEIPNVPTLRALSLKDASDGSVIAFTPSFTSDTEEYTATVGHGVQYVEVAATTADSQATVEYLGASGNAYYDRNGRTDALDSRLWVGSNTYRMKVTAANNGTTKTYTLAVTRRARLKGWFSQLPDSHDGSTPFTVNLEFREEIDSPLANVSAAVAVDNGSVSDFSAHGRSGRKYRMTITPSSAGALRIRLRAARDCSESHSICSTSGKQFAREIGRWVSTGDDARLRALWLTYPNTGGYLRGSPAFDPDTGAYEAKAPEPTERLVLVAAPYTPGATVTFSGSTVESTADRYDGGATATFRVAYGTARVMATVTAVDGVTTRTYTYTVHRSRENPVDRVIRNLTVTPISGSLNAFRKPWPGAATYFAEVSTDTTHVTVSGAAVDPNVDLTLHRNSPGLPEFSETDRLDVRNGTVTVVVTLNAFSHRRFFWLIISRDWRGSSMATAVEALMASLANLPSSHDGSTSFRFRVAFSDEVTIDADAMRDHALQVSGGTVTGAAMVDGRSDLWELTVEPSGNGAVTILVPVNRACSETGALCTSDGRMVSTAQSRVVPGPTQGQRAQPTPLTAEFQSVPAEHDGSSAFTFTLTFSEDVAGLSHKTLRNSAFTVSGGTVTKAKRHTSGSNERWTIHVEPDGNDAVTVVLPQTTDCAAAGAICTSDARKLSNESRATVAGPPGLSVADAAVDEGATDAALAFVVRLSREASGPVTVAYATEDVTAVEPADYEEARGTLAFDRGEVEKTVSVRVHADSENEGDETLTLKLSNPSGAYLADAEATGTITNNGPIPRAWLARFGRTVADQVVDAVDARFGAARAPGVEATVAGQALSFDTAAGDAGALEAPDEAARRQALTAWLRGEDGEADRAALSGTRTVTARELFTGTSFALTGGSPDEGTVSAWGRGVVSRFDGREGDLTLDGEVGNLLLGADFTRGRATAGLMLSHARGRGGYRGASAGSIEASLTGLYPYGRYAVSERVSVWGAAGYGEGTLTVEPEEQTALETGMDLAMVSVGVRGVLLKAPPEGGAELAVKSDAMAVRTSSEAVSGSTGNLAAAEADVTRLRLGLEGSRAFRFEDGATLTPSVELGVRHDGGDAETGFGADIGAGLAWSDRARGLSADARARGLLTHEDGRFSERGFAGSLAWDPAPGSGRGPSLSLAQTVGGQASGGMEALLGPQTAQALEAANDNGGNELERRSLEAKAGYGFALFDDRWMGTPGLGLGMSDAGRELMLGWRLSEERRTGLAFGLDVEGARRESADDDGAAGHRLGLGFGWRLEGAQRESFEVRLEGSRLEPANDAAEHRFGLTLNARW